MKISYVESSPSLIETVKSNYELFIIKNYKLEHLGLFHDNDNIYAVISNIEKQSTTLDDIQHEYDYKYRTMGAPSPKFVDKVEKSFTKINLRNIYEKVNLFGQPFNTSEFNNNLSISMPSKFHPFKTDINWGDNTFSFTFKKNINDEDRDEIILLCESLGYYGYNYIINSDPDLQDYNFSMPTHKDGLDLTLIASSYMKKNLPLEILSKYEEDQEFWLENKLNIFSDPNFTREQCLTNSFIKNDNSCFVDATIHARNNIREYLSLYNTVIIAIPLFDSNNAKSFYDIFSLNKLELLELVKRGRIKFVAFQNLHRYDINFLTDVLSVDPECVLFSRRLAASSLLGIRNKTGLFGFVFDSETQYKLLKNLHDSNVTSLNVMAEASSINNAFLEYAINQRGALSVCQFGAASFVSRLYENRGLDYTLELTTSAMSLEFAQGLEAHHFPYDSHGYSEVNACKILNSIYNGVQSSIGEIKESEISTLLSNILTINNDMNVLELDDIMTTHDRRKIPELLSQYSSMTSEELAFKIYSLNKSIREIEKKQKKLAALDFSGFAPVAAGAYMEYKGIAGAGYIALLPWVLKILKATVQDSVLINNGLFEKLEAITYNEPRENILVQKIRNTVKK